MKRLLATGAFAVLIAGCGHDTGDLESGDLESPDCPVARYDWSPRDGGMDALLEGTLELRDGCLVVKPAWETQPPDDVVVPVFPRKYSSWDAAREVLTFGGIEYGMGDYVWVGGGWGPPSEDMDIPTACKPDAYGDVMYVQDTTAVPYSERNHN